MNTEQARAEYITGKQTYAQIAEKFGVSKGYIGRIAKEQGWKKQRDAFRKGIADKAVQTKRERGIRQIERLQDSTEKMVATIERINADMDQFFRWKSEDGEMILNIADTRRLQSMAKVMNEASTAVRNLFEIPARLEDRKDRREERRLKILENRDGNVSDENAGVILMPRPLEEEPEDAPIVEI